MADNAPINPKHSVVDRSVISILENPNDTASRKDGVSVALERLYRLNGTSLLLAASKLLKLGPSTFATACSIFHRFYHQVSLKKCDVWSASMASTLLACKIEEDPRPVRQLILVFAHLYRRRRLICIEDPKPLINHSSVIASDVAGTKTLPEKDELLRDIKPMSPLGPIYQDWYKAALETENLVLRQLGFMLYWIPDSHPHKYILYFVRVLKIDDKSYSQRAWNYCNDSCRLDFCTQYKPELIACASIHMAARGCKVSLPDGAWWESFVGKGHEVDMRRICNGIAALGCKDNIDVVISSHALLKPLNGSVFYDKESFVWSRSD